MANSKVATPERPRAKHLKIAMRVEGKAGQPGNVYQVCIIDGAAIVLRLEPATLQLCLGKMYDLNKRAHREVCFVKYIGA